MSVNDAINQAGGFRGFANISCLCHKSKWNHRKIRRNVFVKNINLEAGDTIIVPRKIITNNPGITLDPNTNII